MDKCKRAKALAKWISKTYMVKGEKIPLGAIKAWLDGYSSRGRHKEYV